MAKANYHLHDVWLISGAAAAGGLLFVRDWIVIGGEKLFFPEYFQLTIDWQIGWVAVARSSVVCFARWLLAVRATNLAANSWRQTEKHVQNPSPNDFERPAFFILTRLPS